RVNTMDDVVVAVRRAVQRAIRYTPLRLAVAVRGDVWPIAAHVQHAITRIVSEAATNVARHARAPLVRVSLTFRGRILRIVVTDDGRGFDVAMRPGTGEGHFGLAAMQERANEINGWLTLRSEPGSGTTVTLEVPAETGRCSTH